ncbi:unnamed protein product, partial [Effrenium voratum]
MVARSGSSARASSLGNVGREYVPKQPRLSLFIPCERGLLNPPRTPEAMDNILQVMEVAWRQVNAARGSTVKLANPEHNLLVSFESARDFMLGMLSEPDPGRKHLDEVFGGDFSRIARVRAILDAAKLSTRNMGDDRVSSCMNAVKSVEGVLKKVKLTQQAKLSGLDPAEQPQGPPWSFELSSSSGNSSIFVVKQMSPSFQHQEGVLIGASNFSSALEEGKLINATESPSKLVSATAKAVLERFGAWNATELTRLFALLRWPGACGEAGLHNPCLKSTELPRKKVC